MKQTLFKKPIQDTIRVQELNHKREKNKREREAFRKERTPWIEGSLLGFEVGSLWTHEGEGSEDKESEGNERSLGRTALGPHHVDTALLTPPSQHPHAR